jgi:hypothetical protein
MEFGAIGVRVHSVSFQLDIHLVLDNYGTQEQRWSASDSRKRHDIICT